MSIKPQKGSGVNGPLWLIAFSLFTIAICMVFLVIDKKFGPPKENTRAEAGSEQAPASPRPERFRSRNVGPAATADTLAEAAPVTSTGASPAAGDAGVENSAAFLPTTMQPKPGDYLPALPRIVGQPNYRTVVKGRVILQGTPPPEQEVQLPGDYPCAMPEPAVLRTHYFSGTNNGLANTVVYIASGLNQPLQVPERTSEFVLTNCRIEPAFNVLVRGQGLRLRDTEGLEHLFDGLGFATNRPGQVELSAGGSATLRTLVYSTNPIPVTCKLHPWETADAWFISSTYYGISSGNGGFSITNVPPGTYQLEAAHWSGAVVQKVSKQITVRQDQATSAVFLIQAPTRETAGRF